MNKGSIQVGFFRDWAKANAVQAELKELTSSDSEAIQKVMTGELDAYLALDAFGDQGSSIPLFKVGSSDFFFAVSKDRPDLLDELNAAMNRIQAENRYYTQHLTQKYIITHGSNLFLGAEEKDWLDSREGAIRVGYLDNFLAFCAADKETGELTGACNRAGYDLLRSSIDLGSTYMLLFDIDNFKGINDTCGHETGDKVLIKLAEVLRNNFRSDD